MRKLLAVLVVVVLVFGLVGTTSAAAPTPVYFINVIPDTVLDVYVDGNLFIEDLSTGEAVGPFVGEIKGMIRFDMIPANSVFDPSRLGPLTSHALLAAGQTTGIMAQLSERPDQPIIVIFSYTIAKTGPGQSSFLVLHAMTGPGLEVLLSPGTANEQRSYYFFNQGGFWTRVPAGPTTASLVVYDWPPSDDPVLGPFTADLKPGKLYTIILYGTLDNIRILKQEFNVGE
jgi:hypothetical protein